MCAGAALLVLACLAVVHPSSAGLVSEHVSDSISFLVSTAAHPQDLARKLARDALDFSRLPDKSQGPQSNYTWAAVARGDGERGRRLLLALDSRVYDVTDFADLHPAGPKPLKRYAGRDASAAMRATAMPPAVYSSLIKYFLVGTIAETEAGGSYEIPKN